jgi:multidrug transporter EmrE-like cation transporter
VYLILAVVAALCFTVGGIFMKTSDGLTKLWPTIAVYALFAVGATLNAILVKKGGELGWAYLLVVGIEAILAFLFGVFLFKESAAWPRILGVALIFFGLVLLRAE